MNNLCASAGAFVGKPRCEGASQNDSHQYRNRPQLAHGCENSQVLALMMDSELSPPFDRSINYY